LVIVQVTEARRLGPCGRADQIWPQRRPSGFRLPLSGEIALGRTLLRECHRVTGSAEARALRALPVGVSVQVIVASVQFLLLLPKVDAMREGSEVLVPPGHFL
jgi:hypothetical protein